MEKISITPQELANKHNVFVTVSTSMFWRLWDTEPKMDNGNWHDPNDIHTNGYMLPNLVYDISGSWEIPQLWKPEKVLKLNDLVMVWRKNSRHELPQVRHFVKYRNSGTYKRIVVRGISEGSSLRSVEFQNWREFDEQLASVPIEKWDNDNEEEKPERIRCASCEQTSFNVKHNEHCILLTCAHCHAQKELRI